MLPYASLIRSIRHAPSTSQRYAWRKSPHRAITNAKQPFLFGEIDSSLSMEIGYLHKPFTTGTIFMFGKVILGCVVASLCVATAFGLTGSRRAETPAPVKIADCCVCVCNEGICVDCVCIDGLCICANCICECSDCDCNCESTACDCTVESSNCGSASNCDSSANCGG